MSGPCLSGRARGALGRGGAGAAGGAAGAACRPAMGNSPALGLSPHKVLHAYDLCSLGLDSRGLGDT